MKTLLKHLTVTVGVHAAEGSEAHKSGDGLTVADVGSFHEFGLGVPRRSFIRDWADETARKNVRLLAKLSKKVLEGKKTFRQVGNLFGVYAVGSIQERISAGISPALTEATLRRKEVNGNSGEVPLIDTGQLRSSITYEGKTR